MRSKIIILDEIKFYQLFNKDADKLRSKNSALNVFNYDDQLLKFLLDNLIKSEIIDDQDNIIIEIMPDQEVNI